MNIQLPCQDIVSVDRHWRNRQVWGKVDFGGIENNGGTGNPHTSKATGATTNAEKLIANGGIGALTHDRSGSG